jgi:hypothetical protein
MKYKFCLRPNRFDLASFLFVLFIGLSCFYSPQAFAFERCALLFSGGSPRLSETDLFSELDSFESQLHAAYAEANAQFGQDQEINTQINMALARLANLSIELESLQDRALSNLPITRVDLGQIFTALGIERARIRNTVRRAFEPNTVPAQMSMEDLWREIEADPSLIQAEKVYQVEFVNGIIISILFSENIVNEVFRSGHGPLLESSIKAIAQIRRGIFGGSYFGPGIKKLVVHSEVYELGAIGKIAGTLRFGGYFQEGVLHFVTWSNSGEHNRSSYITRFRDSVLSARRHRGH